MDYQTLPLEERITRASEYTLLLVADGMHADSIVEELSEMFHLTHQQARQAYEKMRTENSTAYQTTLYKFYLRALRAAGFSIFAGLFFYFMGSELRTSGFGIAFLLLAIFSATQALDILALIARHRSGQKRGEITLTFTQKILRRIIRPKSRPREQTAYSPLPPKYLGSKGGRFEAGMIAIIGLFAVMTLFVTYNYIQGKNTVDESALITSAPKVLYKKPSKEWLSKRDDRHFAYYLSFYEDPHRYRFDETYINYRIANYYLDSMEVGDTITIRFAREDSTNIHLRHASSTFSIYNIARQGVPYADLVTRNKDVNKENKELMEGATIFSIVIVVLYVIIGQFRKWKYKKLIAARTSTAAK